jgi:F-type H+-transporting ATPase subunit b
VETPGQGFHTIFALMSTETKQSSGSPFVNVIVGIVAMVGGTYLAVNEDKLLPFQKALREGQHIEINLGMTIATIGVFLILFPVIKSFFVQPLHDAIAERNSNLERTFSEAEDLKKEMQQLRADYERRLTETEASAREQIQSQIKEAQNLRATLVDEATQKTAALVRQAEQEIAAERERLIGDLRNHVVDLALVAAEKVIRENMDNEKNRRLINDFISELEVAH